MLQYVTPETLTDSKRVKTVENENPPTTKHDGWQRLRHQYGQSPVLSGFLLHSIRLVFIQGETLGLADPLLFLQLDIFLGLLERDIAGKI